MSYFMFITYSAVSKQMHIRLEEFSMESGWMFSRYKRAGLVSPLSPLALLNEHNKADSQFNLPDKSRHALCDYSFIAHR